MRVKRPNRWRSKRYLDYLRGQACCRCGLAPPSQVHHLRKGSDGGIGLKPSDTWGVPVCDRCHGVMQRYEQAEGRADTLADRYRQCLQFLTDFLGGENG